MKLSTDPYLAVKSFLENLKLERNLSKFTIKSYFHYLHRFINWFYEQGFTDLKQLDQNVVKNYRIYLSEFKSRFEKNLSNQTQSYHVNALRSLLSFLNKNELGVLDSSKIELLKVEKKIVKFLNIEMIQTLLSQPDLLKPGGLRDRAILEVLFSTGLRVGELVSLNRKQIDFESREFGVVGKGGKQRIVFLSKMAASWLSRYLDIRVDRWQPLFIRISGKKPHLYSIGEEMRLTTRSVGRIVQKYCLKARLPIEIGPHGIRHSFATDLLSNGASLRDVQEMLGHKNISTTQIYTHVTHPQLKKIHEELHTTITRRN